jgi:hypothetical protein
VESALLSAMAAAAGLVLAFWMQRALVLLLIDDQARQAIHFTLNAHVLAFSGGAAIATLLLFGLVPALRATKVEALAFMRQDSNGARWSRSVLAKGLIVVQIAASLMLLSGAGLLVRSFSKLTALHTGMSVENMLVMKIGLGWREYQQTYPSTVYQEISLLLFFLVVELFLVVGPRGLPTVASLSVLGLAFQRPDGVGRIDRHTMIGSVFDFQDNVLFSFELKEEFTELIGHGEPKRTFRPAEPNRGTSESTRRLNVRQDLPAERGAVRLRQQFE